MPSEIFFRLDDKKKRKILIGAAKEFEAKGIAKATVVNICKNIGIPRITFYSYFETLDDCYEYVLETFFSEVCMYINENGMINVELIEKNYKETGELYECEGYHMSQFSTNYGMKRALTMEHIKPEGKMVLQLLFACFKKYELNLLSREELITELKEINKEFF